MDLNSLQILYIGIAAFLVGFTKTSVGGVGILAVLLMALAIPGKASPGVLLPMLIAADLMAVGFYRRSCQWRVLVRLIPMALIGVGLGFLVLRALPDARFGRFIGWTILAMLALDLGLSAAIKAHMRGRLMTGIAGVLAGAASMIANAAGPVFGIYLLQLGLNKAEFVGTRSWFFLLMNIAKVPFALSLGTISTASLTVDLYALPVILLGGAIGVMVLKIINIQLFRFLIRVAVLVAAARLILG